MRDFFVNKSNKTCMPTYLIKSLAQDHWAPSASLSFCHPGGANTPYIPAIGIGEGREGDGGIGAYTGQCTALFVIFPKIC